MCNLYSMTATVDEIRRVFGPFAGDTLNLPSFDAIYPGKPAPVLRPQKHGELKLEMMEWGFPGRCSKGSASHQSSFWRSALKRPDRRCIVPVTRFCE